MGLLRFCFGLALVTASLSAQGVIVAGRSGQRGYDGDDKPATSALLSLANVQNGCNDPTRFEQTSHISFDARGNLYLADSDNHRIRRIDTSGVITTVAGTGEVPAINSRCEPTGAVVDGPALSTRLFGPSDVVVHPNGNLIIADQQNNRIRQVTPDGRISTIVGSGTHNLYAPNIPATSSPMDWPSAVALDANGTLYFAELHSNRVGKIVDGRIVTVAGTGFPGYNGDGMSANAATLSKPAGIAIDPNGNLLIADTG